MMQLDSRYRAVLDTYSGRRGFRILAIVTLADVLVLATMIGFESLIAAQVKLPVIIRGILGFILDLSTIAPFVLFVVFGGMMMLHVREQLNLSRAAVIPGFYRPHLLVGFLGLVGVPAMVLALLFGTIHILEPYESLPRPLGAFAILMGALAITAWFASVKSPWYCLLVMPLACIAMTSKVLQRFMDGMMGEGPRGAAWDLVAAALLVLDLAAILALFHRLTRLSQRDASSSRRTFVSAKKAIATSVAPFSPHRVLSTPLSRAWHRRHGVLAPFAPWVVGGSLGAALLVITSVFGGDSSDLLRSVALPTVVPGIVVSLIWRERWMNLGYESLYPADRGQFVQELLVATAISLAELWFATALAVLPPILIISPRLLATPMFQITLIASAAMQFMAFGIMFLSALFRPMLPYVNVITVLAQLIPISFAWAQVPGLSQHGLLVVAGIEMGIGLAVTMYGYATWCRADLA